MSGEGMKKKGLKEIKKGHVKKGRMTDDGEKGEKRKEEIE